MIYKVFLWGMMIASLSFASAQEVYQGSILDTTSGEPLINAFILYGNDYSVTDKNGYYHFSHNPTTGESITIQALGYEDKELSFNELNQDFNVIELFPSILNEVVISDKRKEISREGQASGALYLDSKGLQKVVSFAGEPDLVKYLSQRSGVAGGLEGKSDISVRGGGLYENQYLIDGTPVYNTGHLYNFTSLFNSYAMKGVTFHKGYRSAEYGGWLSSLTEIHLKDGNTKSWNMTADIGLIDSNLLLEGPLDKKGKLTAMIAGRSFYLFPIINTFNKSSSTINTWFYDFNGKIKYRFNDRSSLALSTFYTQDIIDVTDSNNNSNSKYKEIEEQNISNQVYSLVYKNRFSDKWNVNINGGFSKNTNDDSQERTYAVLENQSIQSITKDGVNFKSSLLDNYFKSHLSYLVSSNLSLSIGGDYIYHLSDMGEGVKYVSVTNSNANAATSFANGKLKSSEYSIFSTAMIEPMDNVTIYTGLRYSNFKYKQTFRNIEPRVAVTYRMGDYELKTGYNKSYQYLHAITNNTTSVFPITLWHPSTSQIAPQESDLFDVELNSTLGNLQYSIGGYYKILSQTSRMKFGQTHEIRTALEEDILISGGSGKSYGIETNFIYNTNRLQLELNYTYSKSDRKFTEINSGRTYPFKYQRDHNMSLQGSYKLSSSWSINSNFILSSGHKYSFPVSYIPDSEILGTDIFIYKDINNITLPVYHRLDLGAVYTQHHEDYTLDVKFGAYNIYNSQIVGTVYPEIDEYNNYYLRGVILSGLVPYLNFTISKKL